MNEVPKDPVMLFSWLNTMLRDHYDSLDELCKALDLDRKEIVDKMERNGFSYIPQVNQFR